MEIMKKTFSIKDVPYRRIGDLELQLRIYEPEEGTTNWIMETHGGAWANNDRTSNVVLHESVARIGVGVVGIDFRLSSQAKYPGPLQDINYAIRWFKAHAVDLGITISKLGGLGTSSGGQQMGLIALKPNDPEYCPAEPELGPFDASIDFFAACWPILDPLARYRMALETGNERLVTNHNKYFEDEDAMERANPYHVLIRGEATHLPPISIIQGTEDNNVNHSWQDLFADQYIALGGECAVHKFKGQPHTFASNNPDSPESIEAITILQNFIKSQTA